jgi:sulfur-carrier protein
MSITVQIPPALRTMTKAESVQVDATSVSGAIEALDKMFPGIAIRVCNELGQARKHILIYVDQEDIRYLQGMATPLRGGETVHILPAVSGG